MKINNKFNLKDKIQTINGQTGYIYKIGVDANKIVTYLIFDNTGKYEWYDEYLLSKPKNKKIGF